MAARSLRTNPLGASAFLVAALALAASAPAQTIRYVGTGATCDQVTHYSSLALALLGSIGAGADEIRLTTTISYTDLEQAISNYKTGSLGNLVIAGGYSDCDDTSASGRTTLDGKPTDDLLTVTNSTVTLRDLELTGAGLRGLWVSTGSNVTLQNVIVRNNAGGIAVTGGGDLSINAASRVENNQGLLSEGGGLWCNGAGSSAAISGDFDDNRAEDRGGNLYVGNGCFVELYGGASIVGRGWTHIGYNDFNAFRGGGIFVENATLVATGGAQLVEIRANQANFGGGIYATGATASVALLNTHLLDNYGRQTGAGIHVADGATLTMDRVAPCPFIISCSLLGENFGISGMRDGFGGLALYVDSASAYLANTILRGHYTDDIDDEGAELVKAENSATIEIDGLGAVSNSTVAIFHLLSDAELLATHVTGAQNSYTPPGGGATTLAYASVVDGAFSELSNSVFMNTSGFDTSNGGFNTADCLLVDNAAGINGGAYVGTAQFINAPGNDIRQLSTSPSVDMCGSGPLALAGPKDIELQARGYDAPSNPNGSPGEANGTWDAGFDEYVPGNLIFADNFATGNTSRWSAAAP